MNQIQLKEVLYLQQVSGVELRAGKITGSASNVPSMSSCADIHLREYVDHVHEIARLLSLYKAMVQYDCTSVRSSVDTIKAADRLASFNFLEGVINAAVEAGKNNS